MRVLLRSYGPYRDFPLLDMRNETLKEFREIADKVSPMSAPDLFALVDSDLLKDIRNSFICRGSLVYTHGCLDNELVDYRCDSRHLLILLLNIRKDFGCYFCGDLVESISLDSYKRNYLFLCDHHSNIMRLQAAMRNDIGSD